MKSFAVLALLVAAAVAAPANNTPDGNAVVVRQESDNIGLGTYNYVYETSNNIAAQESGQLEGQGTEQEGIEVAGSFQYVGDDGVLYKLNYRAGRNGYQPEAAYIPK